MKTEIKKRWVEALRSGEYTQGRHTLKTPEDTYCCLGVLCEIAKEDGVGYWDDFGNFVVDESDFSSGTLPVGVAEWAGTGGNLDPRVEYGGGSYCLSSLNDSVELPFDRIADLVEEQL